MHKIASGFIAVAFALSLAACGTTGSTTTQFVSADVPAALRHCAAEPAVPKGDYTQRDVAIYIEKLRAALRNCKGNLAGVDKILTTVESELKAHAKK